LEAVDLKQAIDIDPCLFIFDKATCLVCVNDTLLCAKNDEDTDEVICQLSKEHNMALEVEDDVVGFLGAEIKKDHETGVVTMKQKGLKP
jgi:hypothetical protein